MRAQFWCAAAAAALAAGCGLGAPAYPEFAQTAYRIEGAAANPDGGGTIATVIYRDGPHMRVETNPGAADAATIVFDRATNAAYVLSVAPAQPAAQAAEAADATAAPAEAETAAAPPAGVAIRVADADAPQPMEAPWAALGADGARHTGACEAAGESGQQWRPRQTDHIIERTACITDDGIVLRVTEGDRVIFEATRLERGAQDAALFGVPPGYQVVDAEAVVDQVGETMEQMDSVSGEEAPAPSEEPRG